MHPLVSSHSAAAFIWSSQSTRRSRSPNCLAALAFDGHIALLIRLALGYLTDDSQFDGVGFSSTLQLAPAKRGRQCKFPCGRVLFLLLGIALPTLRLHRAAVDRCGNGSHQRRACQYRPADRRRWPESLISALVISITQMCESAHAALLGIRPKSGQMLP